MAEYTTRDYRNKIRLKELTAFNVCVKETDLWISAERDLQKEAEDLVFNFRYQIENYIKANPNFLSSLKPLPKDPFAPDIVKEMILCTEKAGVGPMASVAGAIAQYVGYRLLEISSQIIIENGGDIFLNVSRDVTVSLFAGKSPLSEKVGLVIKREMMPLGVCSSSGKVGHSLSFGKSDVICVLAHSAVLADGAATSLGNRINSGDDLKRIPRMAEAIEGVLGGVAIIGDQMTAWGEVELTAL